MSAGKSLSLAGLAAPVGKMRLSPRLGALSPTQLAAVVHLLSARLPLSQTAAATRVSTTSLLLVPPVYEIWKMDLPTARRLPLARPVKVPLTGSVPSLLMMTNESPTRARSRGRG